MVDHKKHIEFEEDFHAMAVLTMIKSNQQKLLLPSKVIGKQIFNSLMLFFLQNCMLSCMLYSMTTRYADNFHFASSYAVYIVKFPSAVCLHFVLYPEVMQGMNIMKYANN